MKTLQHCIAILLCILTVPSIAQLGSSGSFNTVRQGYGSNYVPANHPVNNPTDISDYFNSPDVYVTQTLGINMNEAPRRALVHRPVATPENPGPFPVVIIVHGNHDPAVSSFLGYEYLQEHLASHGYFAVSIEQDFLNQASGEFDARAIMILRHLQLLRQWNSTPGHSYENLLDMDNIGLIGHSRGGEAIVLAKKFNTLHSTPYWPPNNFFFNIKALFAIAPTDKSIHTDIDPYANTPYFTDPNDPFNPHLYQAMTIEDAHYAVLQGSHDEDIQYFVGQNQYERANVVTNNADYDKAAIWVYGANHKHFNELWSAPCEINPHSNDCGATQGIPAPQPLNALINPADSRQTAKVYTTAFLNQALKGIDSKTVLATDNGDDDLPNNTTIITRYQDSNRVMINHFQEDDDLITGSLAGVSNQQTSLLPYEEQYFFDSENIPAWFAYASPDYPHLYTATDGMLMGWNNMATDQYQVNFANTGVIGPLVANHPNLSFDTTQIWELNDNHNTNNVDQNFSVQLTFNFFGYSLLSAEIPVSNYRTLPYADHVYFAGQELEAHGSLTHNVMKTIRMPISDFTGDSWWLNPSNITGIIFKFNQNNSGLIAIDNLQITQ